MNLFYIYSPNFSYWEIGYIKLHAYSLCILSGILVAFFITNTRWKYKDKNYSIEDLIDIFVWTIFFSIVGGRAYHLITSPTAYLLIKQDPWEIIRVWHGGLGIYGAIIFGSFAIFLFCKFYNINFTQLIDSAAPGILAAQSIGRWGNWFNQELFGKPTNLPWGLQIESKNHNYPDNTFFHPTFLYESLWNFLGVFLLLRFDKSFKLDKGSLFCLYIVYYSFGRIIIEPFRIDSCYHFLGLRLNSFISLIILILSLFFLIKIRRNNKDNS